MGSEEASSTPSTGIASRQRAWLLVGMVVVALLLRLPMMGRSIWFDEACMSDQRIGTFAQLLATLYIDIHPPLFITFMHVWNGVFGDGEWSMRMPALLSGLSCIPLLWWVGHRLVGHGAALWAAALLTLSPVHIWYCAEARLYAPMVMCTLVAFGTFDRLLDEGGVPRRGLWLLHGANVAVMLALHYYLGVVVVALAGLAPIVARDRTKAASRMLLLHGIGIVLLGGFVMAKQALGTFETGQDYLHTLGGTELFGFVFGWCWTGNTLAPQSVAVSEIPIAAGFAAAQRWLGTALCAAGLATIWRQRLAHPRGYLVPIGLMLLPSFLMVCAWAGYGKTYLERTLIPSLPFVLLLAGAGIMLLPGRLRSAVGAITLGFAIASVVALFVYRDNHWTVYKPNPDWRSAAAWLGSEIDTGGAGRPVFTSMPNPRPLSYYDVRIQDAKTLEAPMTPKQLGDKVRRRLGGLLGDLAQSYFGDFVAHNDALRKGARLMVRRSRPMPSLLPFVEPRPDDICYLVRNHWHPHVSVDGSVEALLQDPQVELLDTRHFPGISVYKVRIAP